MKPFFFTLERQQFFRSPYWQKSLAINILLVFVALYFIVIFLSLGLGLYPMLKEQYPDADPFIMVNGFLFYWFLADLIMRFFFQKLPVMNIKPLLTLPIKKSKIIHFVLRKSTISFFNTLPLFTAIPFALVLIFKNYAVLPVVTWVAFVILATLIINFLNFIIESKSAETELSFLPIIAFVGILYGVNYFEIFSLSESLGNSIHAEVENPILLVLPLLVLIGLYTINYRILEKKLYIDEGLKTKTQIATPTDMEWTRKFGAIAPFLQLDLKLLWRNKRPKSSIFIVLIGLFYGLLFYPNPTYQNILPMYVFVGIFVTGIFLINFGQFIPAWDSGYYKLLMSQNIKYKEYLNSKYTLMAISAVIMFVLSIPYVYFGWKILLIHLAAMVYNIGVNVYVLLYAGSFNRKSIDLNQRAVFNYQGTGAVQWLVGIPLMLIPMLLFYVCYKLMNFESGIAVLFLLGIIGIIFHQKIMNFITKKYLQSKYQMISAFGTGN
jgi:hypothetical protein